MLILSALLVIAVETLLMLVLEYSFALDRLTILVLDGLILSLFVVLVLFPLNYYFVVRPMAQQIEARQLANLELRKLNEVQEGLFSIKDLCIAYLDTDLDYVRVNDSFALLANRPAEELVGRNHMDAFPDMDEASTFQEVIRTGQAHNRFEQPIADLEGTIRYWDISIFPVRDADTRLTALLMVLYDVTARRTAERARMESERRFRAVFDQTFQHIGLLDPDGSVLLSNQTALEFTGTTASDVHGRPIWQLPWWEKAPEQAEVLRSAVQRAAAGETIRGEIRICSASGRMAVMDASIKPLLDEQGAVVLLIYEARDVTEQQRMVEALRESEEKVQGLYMAERRARQLAETLRSAGLALSSSLNTTSVLNALLDHLAKVIPYSSSHVMLFEGENSLVVELARGEEDWPVEQRLLGRHLEVSDLPFLQPMLEERRLLNIPDTTTSPNFRVWAPHDRARSWLGIPLLAGDQVIGLCSMKHPQPNFFTSDHMHLAHTLISQARVAVQNAWLFEQVRDGRERLQALSRRLVEVQENERQYIARELHDEAGQGLASLMVGLRLVERDSANQEAVVARSVELKEIADGVLENLRRLAIDLRPAALDHMGLVPALRQHAERISDQHSLTVQFSTLGKVERLPPDIETAVYRIVQEGLTNIVRHSCATRVDILLERRGDRLLVVVEDNGVGFDSERSPEGRLGLIGMRERADMLSGKLTVESVPGQGTTLLLEVPCPSAS